MLAVSPGAVNPRWTTTITVPGLKQGPWMNIKGGKVERYYLGQGKYLKPYSTMPKEDVLMMLKDGEHRRTAEIIIEIMERLGEG